MIQPTDKQGHTLPLNTPLAEQPVKRQFPQTGSRPQSEQPIPVHQLSIRLFIVLIGFIVVSIGVMTLARRGLAPTNPFAAFSDIFPGQSIGVLVGRGFLCVLHDHPASDFRLPRLRCALDVTSEMFSRIWVITSSSGMIEEVSFMLRDDTFRVGDLALLLGVPFNRDVSSTVGFYKQGLFVVASTGARRRSLMSPILKVTFTNISTAS